MLLARFIFDSNAMSDGASLSRIGHSKYPYEPGATPKELKFLI